MLCVLIPAAAHAAPNVSNVRGAGLHVTLPPVRSYTSLIEALKARRVVAATIDERTHVASVVFRGGAHASVPYPVSDASLPLRMAEGGVDVTMARPGGGFPWQMFLLFGGIGFMALVSLRAASSRRARAAEATPNAKGEGIRNDIEVATAPETRRSRSSPRSSSSCARPRSSPA